MDQLRIISTGNLLTRRGSVSPLVFDSVANAEMYIEIYALRRSIMEIVPDTRRKMDMSEFD